MAIQTRSGMTFSGANSSGWAPRNIQILIGGVDRTSSVEEAGCVIQQRKDGGWTASFDVRNTFTPTVGADVRIVYRRPDGYVFTGTVMRVTESSESVWQDPIWTIQATDYRWLLDRYALVTARFASMGVNCAAAQVVAMTNGGFFLGNTGSASIDDGGVSFSNARMSEVFDTLARIAGWRGWWVSPNKHINFFTSGGIRTTKDVQTIGRHIRFTQDISQGHTSAIALARAVLIAETVPAGATTVQVSDVTPFSPTGGNAIAGTEDFAYTGVQMAESVQGGAVVGQLTGVTGVGSDIPLNTPVAPYAQVNNNSAQTALSTLLGGISGVSLAFARSNAADQTAATALATRIANATPATAVSKSLAFTTRIPNFRPGGFFTQNAVLPSPYSGISGSFEIDSVTLVRERRSDGDDFERAVETSVPYTTFAAVLAQSAAAAKAGG